MDAINADCLNYILQPIDMLERALSAIANETSKSSYTVDMTGSETTSKVSVTKKKKRGKLTGKGKLAVFTPKPFLAPDQEYVNPTPRMYSSTYGGTKWPENQPFVCEYCRQINPNAKQYKVHLRHKHKDGKYIIYVKLFYSLLTHCRNSFRMALLSLSGSQDKISLAANSTDFHACDYLSELLNVM